jgi:polysaccharide export outer membrane protein
MPHSGFLVDFKIFIVIAVCLGLALSGSAAPAQAQAEKQQPAATAAAPPGPVTPGTEAAATLAPVDPKTFVIGALDVLFIKVWREPELSGSVAVRPDGKITLPLVGDIDAAGYTPELFTV